MGTFACFLAGMNSTLEQFKKMIGTWLDNAKEVLAKTLSEVSLDMYRVAVAAPLRAALSGGGGP
jgi:hypothetical protein